MCVPCGDDADDDDDAVCGCVVWVGDGAACLPVWGVGRVCRVPTTPGRVLRADDARVWLLRVCQLPACPAPCGRGDDAAVCGRVWFGSVERRRRVCASVAVPGCVGPGADDARVCPCRAWVCAGYVVPICRVRIYGAWVGVGSVCIDTPCAVWVADRTMRVF